MFEVVHKKKGGNLLHYLLALFFFVSYPTNEMFRDRKAYPSFFFYFLELIRYASLN